MDLEISRLVINRPVPFASQLYLDKSGLRNPLCGFVRWYLRSWNSSHVWNALERSSAAG